MTNVGKLENKNAQKQECVIDGAPYEVLPFVVPYLNRCNVGGTVEYSVTKDGKINKIAPHNGQAPAKADDVRSQADIDREREEYNNRLNKAGFKTGNEVKQEQKKEDCTSNPKTPACTPGLKSVEGQITVINHDKRNLSVKSIDGIITPITWAPAHDDQMNKQKQWWFVHVTGEDDAGILKLVDIAYWQKPANWPAPSGGKGGRPFVPRNEKPMLYESVFKSLCEMFDPDKDGKGKSFEENARRVWQMTEEIGDKMAAKAGV